MTRSLAKILVVEDDPNMLSALSDVLETQGFDVTRAASAEEAVTITAQHQFDLIVTDIRMGREDGLQALEKARQVQPGVGALVVSGYASEEDTLRAVSLNVGGYLKKPFKMKEFLEHVQRILEQRRGELRRVTERTQLRRALWTSWETLLQVIDQYGLQCQPGQLFRVPTLAASMAQLAGSSPGVPDQLRLGLALRAVKELAPLQSASFLENLKNYPGVAALFGEGRLPLDGNRPEQKIVEWALSPEPEKNLPDGLRPYYERARTAPAAEAAPALTRPASQESLLTLARTLERGGDHANARKAYEEMLRRPLPTGEEVEALLGLARMASNEGEPENAAQMAERARKAASSAGPALQGQVALQQGILLRSAAALEDSAQLFEALDLQAGLAQARLAQAVQSGQGEVDRWLECLLLPENQGELSVCADWLVDGLLQAGQGQPASLRLLLQRTSREVAPHLSGFGEAARARVLQLFEGAAGTIPSELLHVLQEDPDPQVRAKAAQFGSGGQASGPMLEIHSFGLFEVYTGQKHVPESAWKTQKVKYLLAYLAANGSATEDMLEELFWPESLGGSRKSLNHALSTIRTQLRAGLGIEPLLREGTSVRLNPQIPLWHDFQELEAAWQAAQSETNPEQAQQHYRRVVTLHRGAYLEGCYLDWALEMRKNLESKVSEAAYQVTLRALDKQRWQEAIEYSTRCLSLDATRQDALVLQMRAHTAAGRPAAAVSEFERYSRWLRAEYEAEPTIEVLREYHKAKLGIS